LTFVPLACDEPAPGELEITFPFPTDEDAFIDTAPTPQCAFLNAAFAFDSFLPFSAGTLHFAADFALPLETVSLTFVPFGCVDPAPGELEITFPFATDEDAFFVTAPTAQCAFLNAAFAFDSVLPFTAGTLHFFAVDFALPLLTVNATFVPAGSTLPAAGLLEITLPFATVDEFTFVTFPTPQWAVLSAILAAATVSPASAGTVQFGPLLMVNATWVPPASMLPAAGLLEITSPLATVDDGSVVTVPTAQFALVRALVAAACVCPASGGTVQTFVFSVGMRFHVNVAIPAGSGPSGPDPPLAPSSASDHPLNGDPTMYSPALISASESPPEAGYAAIDSLPDRFSDVYGSENWLDAESSTNESLLRETALPVNVVLIEKLTVTS
jgi:hypothetical protein